MTAEELREKVLKAMRSVDPHVKAAWGDIPEADAAIRVVIEAAMQKCTDHAEYMKDMKTPPGCDPWVQQEIAREWDYAALQISSLLPEEQQ